MPGAVVGESLPVSERLARLTSFTLSLLTYRIWSYSYRSETAPHCFAKCLDEARSEEGVGEIKVLVSITGWWKSPLKIVVALQKQLFLHAHECSIGL